MSDESLRNVVIVSLIVSVFGLFWAYDRWVRPARIRWKAQQLLQRIQSGSYVHGKKFDHVISFDATGFRVESRNRGSTPVQRWDGVERITAYKRDEWTVDCICLLFGGKDGTLIELNEDLGNWQDFIEALPTYLPGARKCHDWFREVAFPAFATNPTAVYDRANGVTERSA